MHRLRALAVFLLLSGVASGLAGLALMQSALPLWLMVERSPNVRLLLAIPGTVLAVMLVEAARLQGLRHSAVRLVFVGVAGAFVVTVAAALGVTIVCWLAGVPKSSWAVVSRYLVLMGAPLAVMSCVVLPLIRQSPPSAVLESIGRAVGLLAVGGLASFLLVSIRSPLHLRELPAGGIGLMGGGKRVWSQSLDGHVRAYSWGHRLQDRTEIDIDDDGNPDCIEESVTFGDVMVSLMRLRANDDWRWLEARVRFNGEWHGPALSTCRALLSSGTSP